MVFSTSRVGSDLLHGSCYPGFQQPSASLRMHSPNSPNLYPHCAAATGTALWTKAGALVLLFVEIDTNECSMFHYHLSFFSPSSSFLPFTLHAYTWATWLQSWLKYLMDIIHCWYSLNVVLIHFKTAKPSHFSRMPGLLNKESILIPLLHFWGHISLFLLSFWLCF